jgi:NAD(P) transhydrogenase subunit beta
MKIPRNTSVHKLNLAALVVSFVLLVVFVRTESVGLQVLALLVIQQVVAQHKARSRRCPTGVGVQHRDNHRHIRTADGVSFVLLVVFVRTESVGLQVLALLVMTIIALAFGWKPAAAAAQPE